MYGNITTEIACYFPFLNKYFTILENLFWDFTFLLLYSVVQQFSCTLLKLLRILTIDINFTKSLEELVRLFSIISHKKWLGTWFSLSRSLIGCCSVTKFCMQVTSNQRHYTDLCRVKSWFELRMQREMSV